MSTEPKSRALLRTASRVVVKCGTSIVTNENGQVSLTRLGAIAEQISELVKSGTEVIFVSSGAVGMGKRVLRKQGQMSLSLNELHSAASYGGDSDGNSIDNHLRDSNSMKARPGLSTTDSFLNLLSESNKQKQYDSACAAAGQFELMNFYSSLFSQREISCSQILVTQADFQDEGRLQNLRYAIGRLLGLGIVPIINENDAVSANVGWSPSVFSDNDSLSALCARSFGAQVLLMLTDVDGVFDRPPSEEGAKMVSFFTEEDDVTIGEKSTHGRGGMSAKIEAATNAVKPGSECMACVVVSGSDYDCIRAILGKHNPKFGPPKGTLFATPGSLLHNVASEEAKAEMVCPSKVVSKTYSL